MERGCTNAAARLPAHSPQSGRPRLASVKPRLPPPQASLQLGGALSTMGEHAGRGVGVMGAMPHWQPDVGKGGETPGRLRERCTIHGRAGGVPSGRSPA